MNRSWVFVAGALVLILAASVVLVSSDHDKANQQKHNHAVASRVDTHMPAPKARATTTVPTLSSHPLLGKVVTIDPGHNGGNFSDPSYINTLIWNGREEETCNTTGTETDAGYTEALFNWNVANYLAADLEAEGADVVLTRHSNSGVGPCVNERAAIANSAHSDAALAIHADGGPATGRGFAILEPVADGINNSIVGSSQALGDDILSSVLSSTTMPVSTYDGVNGIQPRDNLAGLNLSTVPVVLIECGNMRNATDAALLESPQWQMELAEALAAGITAFLANPN
jgi:N-acetylmuramoyl-L-alanine amidase